MPRTSLPAARKRSRSAPAKTHRRATRSPRAVPSLPGWTLPECDRRRRRAGAGSSPGQPLARPASRRGRVGGLCFLRPAASLAARRSRRRGRRGSRGRGSARPSLRGLGIDRQAGASCSPPRSTVRDFLTAPLPGRRVGRARRAARKGGVEQVVLTDGVTTWTRALRCSLLRLRPGSQPGASALARLRRAGEGRVAIDDLAAVGASATSTARERLPGIGGVELSLVEGGDRGSAAGGEPREAQRAPRAAAGPETLRGDRLERAFALRAGALKLPRGPGDDRLPLRGRPFGGLDPSSTPRRRSSTLAAEWARARGGCAARPGISSSGGGTGGCDPPVFPASIRQCRALWIQNLERRER